MFKFTLHGCPGIFFWGCERFRRFSICCWTNNTQTIVLFCIFLPLSSADIFSAQFCTDFNRLRGLCWHSSGCEDLSSHDSHSRRLWVPVDPHETRAKGKRETWPYSLWSRWTLQRTRNHRQMMKTFSKKFYLANIPRYGQRVLFISNIVSVWLSLNTNRPQWVYE